MTGTSATDPRFFNGPAAFRAWLERSHERSSELWVGFHKRGTGRSSMTWPESVDEALCFGWIDGIRKRVDEESYVIRFTPRKPGSIWSVVNVKKMHALIATERAWPAGVAAFERRSEAKTAIYSYERRRAAELGAELEVRFSARRKAWAWFQAQAPWYRRTSIHWVTSAKREETRLRRLEILIECSQSGERIPALKRTPAAAR